ncbi:serine hydrolase [Subtercola sp. Z020]|uniref:serine hydrolase n=1 Tax=Subtercola sp. Z020 TaxID=2080582 RepID=UPI000CE8614B|nr:serine hydrolase [Subtercola sp. Z020]PPF89702.1 serine hydrolase [Subtercola sp. Z020]
MAPPKRKDRRRAQPGLPSGRRSSAQSDTETFKRGFVSLTKLALSGVQITASALDVATEKVLFSIDDHLSVPTASLGKVLLLIEVAARLTQRDISAHGLLDRTVVDSAAGTGLWQHLQVPTLPVADLAVLVGASSDNLATNVLLRQIGLDAVRARGEALGLHRTFLLDKVRDYRGPDDAPHFSVGSARELATLFRNLAEGSVVDVATSQQVLAWLGLGSDLSMVASAFGLDPLSHVHSDHGLLLVNKTGSGQGIRSEVGVLRGPRASVAYAVTMRYNDAELTGRLAVLDGMRTLGTDILEYVY